MMCCGEEEDAGCWEKLKRDNEQKTITSTLLNLLHSRTFNNDDGQKSYKFKNHMKRLRGIIIHNFSYHRRQSVAKGIIRHWV